MSLITRFWHDIGIVLMLALICFFVPLETPVLKPKYRPPDINSSCRLHKPLISRTAWVLVDSLGAELTFNREPGTDIHKVLSTTSSNIPEMIFVARVDKPGYTVPRVLALATGAPVSATRLAADSLGISSPERIMNVLEGPLQLVGCDLWETISWERWDYNGKVFCFNESTYITGDEEEHNKLRQFLQADSQAKFTVLHLGGFDNTAHIFWSNDGLQYREKLAEYVERLPAIENDFQASTKVPLLLVFVADHGHDPDGQHKVNTFNVLHATLVTRIVLPKDQQPSNTVTSALEQVTAKWQSTRKRAVAKASDLTDSTSFVRDWSRLGKTGVAWQVDLTTTTALVNGARLPSRSVGVVLPETVLQAAASQPGICSDISSIEGCAEILESFLDEAVGCNAEHFAHLLRIPVPSGMSTEDLWTWLVETRPHLYYTLVQKNPLAFLARLIPVAMLFLCVHLIVFAHMTIFTVGILTAAVSIFVIIFVTFTQSPLVVLCLTLLTMISLLSWRYGIKLFHQFVWILSLFLLTIKECMLEVRGERPLVLCVGLLLYFFGLIWTRGIQRATHGIAIFSGTLFMITNFFGLVSTGDLELLRKDVSFDKFTPANKTHSEQLEPMVMNYPRISQALPFLLVMFLLHTVLTRFFPRSYSRFRIPLFLAATFVGFLAEPRTALTRGITALVLFATSSQILVKVSLQRSTAAATLAVLILRSTYDFTDPFLHWSSRTWQASHYVLGKQFAIIPTPATIVNTLLIGIAVWYCALFDQTRVQAGKSRRILHTFLSLIVLDCLLIRFLHVNTLGSAADIIGHMSWTLGEIFMALLWSILFLSLRI